MCAIPARPRRAEIRAGVQQSRSGLDAILDADAQVVHDVRVHLAGRKRGRHAIREKQRRIRGGFVFPAGAEELDRVVRVEVEQSGNRGLGVGERDSFGVRRRDGRVSADAQELPGANHDAGIADAVVAVAVKSQPPVMTMSRS